jgi:hypothetical protein
VIIGQNNVGGERLSVADAEGLTGLASRIRLGRDDPAAQVQYA